MDGVGLNHIDMNQGKDLIIVFEYLAFLEEFDGADLWPLVLAVMPPIIMTALMNISTITYIEL